MLQQEDKNEFITTLLREIYDHKSRGHWTMIPRANKPADAKTIQAAWSFKRKVFHNGRISKHH